MSTSKFLHKTTIWMVKTFLCEFFIGWSAQVLLKIQGQRIFFLKNFLQCIYGPISQTSIYDIHSTKIHLTVVQLVMIFQTSILYFLLQEFGKISKFIIQLKNFTYFWQPCRICMYIFGLPLTSLIVFESKGQKYQEHYSASIIKQVFIFHPTCRNALGQCQILNSNELPNSLPNIRIILWQVIG